jgi:hypothetical protein
MDLRAFGSTYPYRGEVPYTSGFGIVPPAAGGTPVRFSTCRALFIESKANGTGGYLAVEFSDAPGQVVAAGHLKGDQLFPLSCTAIVSGDVAGVFVLY